MITKRKCISNGARVPDREGETSKRSMSGGYQDIWYANRSYSPWSSATLRLILTKANLANIYSAGIGTNLHIPSSLIGTY